MTAHLPGLEQPLPVLDIVIDLKVDTLLTLHISISEK
jgi:hypothetical protein